MDCNHNKIISELPEWVLIYFEKTSENEYKCNVCDINLNTGRKSLELLHHITKNHKDIYKIHKQNSDAPIKFQIEYLQLNDFNEKPKTKEGMCNPEGGKVIASNEKDAGGDIVEYILLQTEKSKVRKNLRKRSGIWKYFDMISKNKCRCNVCSALMSVKNRNTGNLYRHLRSKHPAYRAEDGSRNSSPEIEFPKKKTTRRIDVDADRVLGETSETLTSSRHSNSPEEEKTQKKYRSWIWDYYKPITKASAMCNVCKKTIWHGGVGTGNMARHLRMKHQLNKASENTQKYTHCGSWIWDYFKPTTNTSAMCNVCKKNIYRGGNGTGDLNKHLWNIHQITKEKTRNKYRSWIWKYYIPISKTSAMCNVCKKSIWHGGRGTGNMSRHLWTKHRLNRDHWVWNIFEKDHDTYSCRMCDFTYTKRENDEANVIAIRDHLGSEHGIYSGDQVVEEEESSEVDDNQQVEVENNEQVEEDCQKTEQNTDVQDSNGEAKGLQENDDSE